MALIDVVILYDARVFRLLKAYLFNIDNENPMRNITLLSLFNRKIYTHIYLKVLE